MRHCVYTLPLLLLTIWLMPVEKVEAQNWSNFSTPNEAFNDEYYDSNIYDDAKYRYGTTYYDGFTPRKNKVLSTWFRDNPRDADWRVGGAWREGNYWDTADYADPVLDYPYPILEPAPVPNPRRVNGRPIYNPSARYPMRRTPVAPAMGID